MFNRLLVFIFVVFLQLPSVFAETDESDRILLASEEWKDFTNRDGTGLYWDIVRYVYEPVGIKIDFLIMPYDASVQYVKRGRADAWLSSYSHEKTFPLYPTWNFDIELVSVMMNKERLSDFRGINSLARQKVAWIRGYDYNKYLDIPLIKHEVDTRKSILKMLKRGRVHYYLDSPTELKRVKEQVYPGDDSLVIRDLTRLKLYPAFSNTPKGSSLRDTWDQRMAEIHRTEKMKDLFKQWKQDYPF